MRQELRELLAPHGTLSLQVDRDDNIHGEPAIRVNVRWRHGGTVHDGEWKFAKGNAMTVEHMAEVIASHMNNPNPGDENV